MTRRNPTFSSLSPNYLFQTIAEKKAAFQNAHPEVELINLGIGDTRGPLHPKVAEAMSDYAKNLGAPEGYSGYGSSEGNPALRQAITERIYEGRVSVDEIFVSDGSKCDIGRLQTLFSSASKVTLQDPTYPVYYDGSLLLGLTPEKIRTLPCTAEKDFIPTPEKADIMYLCNPNNPTGAALTKEALEEIVRFAEKEKMILIYDSAYASYIQDPKLPKSIYEIEGAEKVAIESGSFSKMAGFTGVRLGWTVVPKELQYVEGGSVREDWIRLISTLFNGACNIAQAGGAACLEPLVYEQLLQEAGKLTRAAGEMAKEMRKLGFQVYGGENAPYIWIAMPGKSSWETFTHLLENAHIVSVPGSGFGPAGEGYVRFSAFAGEAALQKALKQLKRSFSLPAKGGAS